MSLFGDIREFKCGTGIAGTTIDVPMSLGGLAPKVIWVWMVGRTDAVGASGAGLGSYNFSYGRAVSTSNRSVIGTHVQAAVNPTSADRKRRIDAVGVSQAAATGAIDGLLDVNDMSTADKVQFIIDQQFPSDFKFIVAALSGSEITGATLIEVTKIGTTGDQDVTGVGFTPTYVEPISIAAGTALPQSTTSAFHEIGRAVVGLANQIHHGAGIDAVATTDTSSYSNDLQSFIGATSTTSIIHRGTVTAGIADGFRINWSENTGAARTYSVLCLAGTFRVELGETDSVPVPEGSIAISAAFDPVLGLIFSACRPLSVNDTPSAGCAASFGAFTGPQATAKSLSQGFADPDNLAAASSQTATATRHLDLYVNLDGTGAVQGAVRVDTAASPIANELILDDAVTDPVTSAMQWVAFGAAPPAAPAGNDDNYLLTDDANGLRLAVSGAFL